MNANFPSGDNCYPILPFASRALHLSNRSPIRSCISKPISRTPLQRTLPRVSVLIRIECKGQIWETFHCPAAIIFSGIPHPQYRRVFSFKLPLFQRPRGRGSISCASVCKVVLGHYRGRCLWRPWRAIASHGLQACPHHTAGYTRGAA